MDPEIKALTQTLLEAQIRTEKALGNLTQAQIETQKAVTETHKAIAELTATITRQAEAADTRMKRVEANLDDLIRTIKAEHTNGKART